jgi:predicted acylesterase/phospholipase RssA
MYKNLKIGLALGGGGARGACHIGVLKSLELTVLFLILYLVLARDQ